MLHNHESPPLNPWPGAEITVCAAHRLQTCHYCCMDFSTMNQRRHQQPSYAHNLKPDGANLGERHLLVGTKVRQQGEKRNYDTVINGCVVDEDVESDFAGMECYILQYEESTELLLYPVEYIHDEFLVLSNFSAVEAKKYLAML
ncbi:hypothetical protein BJ742DRAFT_764422, partial [Cladochytrium replicatum]